MILSRRAARPSGTFVGTLIATAFTLGCCPFCSGDPAELVMRSNIRLEVTASGQALAISAGDGMARTYEWGHCKLSADPCPRTERWFGIRGIYDPAPELVHLSKGCDGITRTVIQEGQIHFTNSALAEWWLQHYKEPHPTSTVWTSDGLVVQFGLVPGRYQINVNVIQVCIGEERPKSLAGARDASVRSIPGNLDSARYDCVKVPTDVMTSTVRTWAQYWHSSPPEQLTR